MAETRLVASARAFALGLVLVMVLTSCVIDDPVVSTADGAASNAGANQVPVEATASFLPTPVPSPTAVAPTAVPTPTTGPTAVPTVAPLPTVVAVPDVAPTIVEPGTIAIPIGVTQFRLSQPRPILQLSGHTLIYVDPDREAEVDIFVPYAKGDGTLLDSYDAVIDYISTDPIFAELEELDPVTIAGVAARVFEGTTDTGIRGFHTDALVLDNENAGWFPPIRVRMWVIDDAPNPIIVTAESLFDPGQYSDAVRLATEVLSTIEFG